MKHLIIFLFIAFIASCSAPKKYDNYIIEAKAPGIYNGMRAYLKITDERGRLINKDTAIVIDEKFSFQGVRKEPTLEYLHINGYNGNLPLIVENGAIEILINKDSLQASTITGSASNSDLKNYILKEKTLSKALKHAINLQREAKQKGNTSLINDLNKSVETSKKTLNELPITHITGNENSFVSIIMLNNSVIRKRNALESIEMGFSKLSQELQNSDYGKKIKWYIAVQKQMEAQKKATEIGRIAPNFSAKTPDDKILALNDIKSKVTIIDFWASWCGPCRRENPNVVKVYSKYHDKGLEIIGVSLDKNGQKNRWLKAIEDDKLPWHHVSNLRGWQDPIAKMYNVQSIPATFILDADGKIIAKNLRGPALETKIAALLN